MNTHDQTKLKIIYEERFRPEVRRLFNRVCIEFRIGVATGNRVKAAKYLPQWETLLRGHYSRVQNGFKGVVGGNTKQIGTEDAVLMALIAWADEHAPESARLITNTTQNNMDAAIIQARQAFSDEGKTDYTDRELALVAATILGRKFLGRESSIIITETQAAAESTKLIEAYALAGLSSMAAVTRERTPDTQSKKEWVDVGDNKVRPGHRAREVAEVGVNAPFVVNGQRMMYPSDNFMGATADNTIKCRCASFYTFN